MPFDRSPMQDREIWRALFPPAPTIPPAPEPKKPDDCRVLEVFHVFGAPDQDGLAAVAYREPGPLPRSGLARLEEAAHTLLMTDGHRIQGKISLWCQVYVDGVWHTVYVMICQVADPSGARKN